MSKIVHRGTLTDDKLKELAQQHLKSEFDPAHNENAISIIKQPDGNWIGYMYKYGRVIKARQYDPQIVLQMLITGQADAHGSN